MARLTPKTTERLTRRSLVCATVVSAVVVPALANSGAKAPLFTPHLGIKAALIGAQSGVFNLADLGRLQTLCIVINGVLIDVHARRNGIFQAKAQARSHSVRTVAPVDVNRLIAAAGGLDQMVNGTARAAGFYAVVNTLAPSVSGSGTAANGRQGPRGQSSLDLGPDAFFDDWALDYDARNGAYSFAARGVQAFWTLEGNP